MLRAAICLLIVLLAAPLPAIERERLDVYRQRREALAAAHPDGVIVLLGYGEKESQSARSSFRQENNFYYLTGWNEPGAVLLLVPARAGHSDDAEQVGNDYREVLFLPRDNPSDERWNGPRAAPEDDGIAALSGVGEVRGAPELDSVVAAAARHRPRVYTLFPYQESHSLQPEVDRRERVQAVAGGLPLSNIRSQIERMRGIKSASEVRLIQKAVDASAAAHREAWTRVRPGAFEYELMAVMLQAITARGCLRPAYPLIIGSGPNSTALHYSTNTRRLAKGELVLIDVGGEYAHYAADITRTVPVDGRFTARQREIYNLVLDVQKKLIARLKPGMTLHGGGPNDLTEMAKKYFDELGRERAGQPMGEYFVHGVGHHVGLEVHDPADLSRPLEPGMVVTIEPGLYLPEENLGVRIEDMLLITPDGSRLLSRALPKDAAKIEHLMKIR
ncbi:MAG: Xaa-Pro peptidase family protein [Acidobacteria bacterium]|nr:Xaa-Pro peptidase family protein [Acidobacteriota bacterium]